MIDLLRAQLDDDDRRRGRLDPAVLPMDRSTRLLLLAVIHILERMDIMASGLDHLRAADAGLASAVVAALAEFKTLATQLGDPDADVESLASDLDAKVTALQKAIANPSGAPPVPVPAPVVVTVTGPAALGIGQAVPFVGASNDGAALSWASSAVAVATVDSKGLVTGVAAGTVTITATNPTGQTASRSVVVA